MQTGRRRMQGQWNHDEPYYRCRFPNEYGLANEVEHLRNIYLAEREVLPPVDDWLATFLSRTEYSRPRGALMYLDTFGCSCHLLPHQ
jgi:hypothetical protein